jgi:NADH-ubiquinone oxidoreductase chain 5
VYLAIVALPGLGALTGFLGRKLGAPGVQLTTSLSVLAAAGLALVAFFEVALCGAPVSLELAPWISSDTLEVRWAFMFDGLTVSMLLAVLVVSAMVHLFSTEYMAGDPHQQRFMAYLSGFTFFMVLLVSADNYALMFLGWEGIGVMSFLLIAFWYSRAEATKSAVQAMLTNRVGDMLLSVGLFLAIALVGSLDFPALFAAAPYLNEDALNVLGLLFLGGCLSKSAQVPLHAWLPNAMEGPTPVSALIHAATLVTAGIYLLLRSSPALEFAPTALLVTALVGAVTALFAATTGLLQNDIKRVIAFSTASQLGYMVAAIGLSQYQVALFHLVNHAFFKALLFLAAGGVLHSTADQQDARRLGGLAPLLPFTYAALLVGSLSLMAFPFLTGNYSKELIISLAGQHYAFPGQFVYWLLAAGAGLTAFYSARLISLAFFGTPAASRATYEHAHEQPALIAVPYLVLALLAIFAGYLGKDLAAGMGSDFLGAALFTRPGSLGLVDAELGLSAPAKLLPTALSLGAAALAGWLYLRNPKAAQIVAKGALPLYRFLSGKWLFDVAISRYAAFPALHAGLLASKVLDKGAVELLGPHGLSTALYRAADGLATLDTGVVTSYALYMTIGLLALGVLAFAGALHLVGGDLILPLYAWGLLAVVLATPGLVSGRVETVAERLSRGRPNQLG